MNCFFAKWHDMTWHGWKTTTQKMAVVIITKTQPDLSSHHWSVWKHQALLSCLLQLWSPWSCFAFSTLLIGNDWNVVAMNCTSFVQLLLRLLKARPYRLVPKALRWNCFLQHDWSSGSEWDVSKRILLCSPRYWENPDYRTAVSIVPTSALTGEGVPDLLYMILKLTQDLMVDKLEVREELECTVIEVKNIEGLGTTIDVVLLNGTLKEGDTIVLAGIGGPIVTTIRALLTPQPMKEMRVKRLIWKSARALSCYSQMPRRIHTDTDTQTHRRTDAQTPRHIHKHIHMRNQIVHFNFNTWIPEPSWAILSQLFQLRNEYVHHAQISTSMGVKISAPGLEDAVAGTELLVPWLGLVRGHS